MFQGLWFNVLGFRVPGCGRRVRVRVEGLGFRVALN